jgi:putative transposon-encoded protein
MHKRHASNVEVNPHVIRDLVKQTHRPEEEVRAVYEEQLALLGEGATVHNYVEVIAGRRTREILKKHHH